jgi:osmotically-inducible protein OsmY
MPARISLALAVFLALVSAAARADPGDGAERYDANRDVHVSSDERRGTGGDRVRPAEAAGDAWVSAKVTAALLMDRELTISDMRVTTRDGQVRLSGVVHRDDEAQAAERIAWRVEGVRAVVNSLSVQPSLSARNR